MAAELQKSSDFNPNRGAYLSFRNVHYSIKDKLILRDVSGYAKPGMLLSILGHPGSGKTTLFDILARTRRLGNVTGEILINGKPRDEYFTRISGYITQRDIHIPTLTVRETLRFSAMMRMKESMPMSEKYAAVERTIKTLNLVHCADTIVGSEMLRGVSGGEKKRVTIGVEAVLNRPLLFIDEPSTGLDAPAAYDVMKSCRDLADSGVTIITAILQPGAQLFSLFDTLMLLSKGEVVYFGPSSQALSYFLSVGLACPTHKPRAEFLHELTDHPEKYANVVNDDGSSSNNAVPKSSVQVKVRKDLVKAYKASLLYEDVGKVLWKGIAPEEVVLQKTLYDDKYPVKTLQQTLRLLDRGITTTKRDVGVVRTRFLRSVILAVVIGTLFLQLGNSQADADNRFGLIFFCLAFAGMGALQALPPLLEERDVFYAQRNLYFFRTRAYFIATTLIEIPLCVVEVLLFALVMYWLTGLRNEYETFFYFFLCMLGIKLASNAFCRLVASVSSSLMMANALAPTGLSLWFLMTGYLLPKNSIPSFWIWMYWMSPFRYGLEGMALNELKGLTFECDEDEFVPPPNSGPPYYGGQTCPISTGDNILEQYDMSLDENRKWLCLLVVYVFYAIFSLSTYFALQYIRTDAAGKSQDQMRIMFKPKKREYISEHATVRGRSNSGDFVSGFQNLESGAFNIDDRDGEGNHHAQSGGAAAGAGKKAPSPTSAPHSPLSLLAKEGSRQDLNIQSDAAGETATLLPKQSMFYTTSASKSLATQGAYLSFYHLTYGVDIPEKTNLTIVDYLPGVGSYFMKKVPTRRKEILKGVTGFVKPGMLVSLMGPSGAGKSTLLDVLAGRKTGGVIGGEILVNGRERDMYFNRISGYCEQQDVMLETQTVRETIVFAALVKCDDSLTYQEKLRSVEVTIDELDLRSHEDSVIGTKMSGLSPELRKKVAIGIELVSGPELLFLDEPTSGLDASSAAMIMKVCRQLAYAGRAVICTIHQPSADLFMMFDWLLLLNQNGMQVYFGPVGDDCETVLGYFRALGAEKAPHKNPADFVLEVTGAGVGKALYGQIDTVGAFKSSKFFLDTGTLLENKALIPPNHVPKAFARIYATSFWNQTSELLRRALVSYARRPLIRRARNFRGVLMGLVIGTMFYNLDDSQAGARNRISLTFFAILFAILSSISAIPLIIQDRMVFYRERQASSYNAVAYWLANALVEIPFCFVSLMIFVLIYYFLCGLNTSDTRFGDFIVIYFVANMIAIYFCQFIASISPGAEVANGTAPVLMTMFALFSGFIIPYSSMPSGWSWMYYISFLRYPLSALSINELNNLAFTCKENSDGSLEGGVPVLVNGTSVVWYCPIQSGTQMLERFDFPTETSDKWALFGYSTIFLCVFSIGTLFSLAFVRHYSK